MKGKARPLEEYLVENCPYNVASSALKRRLLAAGLIANECRLCGQSGIWKGKSLIMHLDHINGRRKDNRLKENLRMLCPNCHSQTDTYAGRNMGNVPV